MQDIIENKSHNKERIFFVKFVPFNQNTISSLINQTIRFSTVYDFNDFNEFNFYCYDNLLKNENLHNFICNYYSSKENILYFNKYLPMFKRYDENLLIRFSSWLNHYNFSNAHKEIARYMEILSKKTIFFLKASMLANPMRKCLNIQNY